MLPCAWHPTNFRKTKKFKYRKLFTNTLKCCHVHGIPQTFVRQKNLSIESISLDLRRSPLGTITTLVHVFASHYTCD